MTARMTHGWLTGHRIRTAIRPAYCDFLSEDGPCGRPIEAGERYVEGNPNGTPGWGADRICAAHAQLLNPAREYGVDTERQLAALSP